MKWYSYSYSNLVHRVRLRVLPTAEYEYEKQDFQSDFETKKADNAKSKLAPKAR